MAETAETCRRLTNKCIFDVLIFCIFLISLLYTIGENWESTANREDVTLVPAVIKYWLNSQRINKQKFSI